MGLRDVRAAHNQHAAKLLEEARTCHFRAHNQHAARLLEVAPYPREPRGAHASQRPTRDCSPSGRPEVVAGTCMLYTYYIRHAAGYAEGTVQREGLAQFVPWSALAPGRAVRSKLRDSWYYTSIAPAYRAHLFREARQRVLCTKDPKRSPESAACRSGPIRPAQAVDMSQETQLMRPVTAVMR